MRSEAILSIAGFLFIIYAAFIVSRWVSRHYIGRRYSRLVSLLAGVATGLFVALALLFLLIGVSQPSPESTSMVVTGLIMLVAVTGWGVLNVKFGKEHQPQSAKNWWVSFKREALQAWKAAQAEVQEKQRAKARSEADLVSLASFSYVDVEGEWTERTVTNLTAYSDGGHRYVHGYCLDRGDVRTFRLDRIKGAVSVQPGGKQLSPAELFAKLQDPGRSR